VRPRRWRQNEFGLGQANQIFAFLSDAKIAGQGELEGLMHIFMGRPLNPRDAETKGLVHETVSGRAIDRAMEIARRLSTHTPEYLGYIKRLVGNAIDTPLAEGLALERNLFMKLCVSDQALARMRSYEEKKITDPSRSLEAQRRINGDRIEHDTYAGDRGNAWVLESHIRLSALQCRRRGRLPGPPGPSCPHGDD
jgi:hypothetical protein